MDTNVDHAHAIEALTDVNLTSLADGDVLAWDLASHKFVNTRLSDARIGCEIEVFGVDFLSETGVALSLDPADTDHVAVLYQHGLTLGDHPVAGTNNALVIPANGRYQIAGWISLVQHATTAFNFEIRAGHGGAQMAQASGRVLPGATFPSGVTTAFIVTEEYAAGAKVWFAVTVTGDGLSPGDPISSLNDSALNVQLIGPATSI